MIEEPSDISWRRWKINQSLARCMAHKFKVWIQSVVICLPTTKESAYQKTQGIFWSWLTNSVPGALRKNGSRVHFWNNVHKTGQKLLRREMVRRKEQDSEASGLVGFLISSSYLWWCQTRNLAAVIITIRYVPATIESTSWHHILISAVKLALRVTACASLVPFYRAQIM